MKLHACRDVTPDGAGLICRQARVGGTIVVLMFSVLLAGVPMVWWWVGGTALLWVPLGLLALAIVPLLVSDLRLKFSAGNWLVWIRPDGIWINLRSYQDRGETESAAVVQLDYAEIAAASRHVERYTTTRASGESVQWKVRSLDLQLTHDDTGELNATMSANRQREQPERVYLGSLRVRSGLTHFPVSLATADVIRVAWRGGANHWVSPSLRRVLAELSGRVKLGEASRQDQPSWRDLSDEECDDQILELVKNGNRMDAIGLLVHRRGYTTTEAHEFIAGLSAQV